MIALAPDILAEVSRICPRTPAALHGYIRAVLGFDIPRSPLARDHHAPFEYVCHAFFEDRSPRDCLVWANRGGGKTQLAAIVTLLDVLFKPGIQIRILGGSFEQSARMYRHLRRWTDQEFLRAHLVRPATERGFELRSGSRVEVLSQSERAVRGQRVHKLRCDEVELFEPEIWRAAQFVTRSGWCGETFVRGSIEALSTMHKPYGLMQQLVADSTPETRRIFHWNVIDVLERCEPARRCETCPLWNDCGGRAKDARGFISIDDAIQQHSRAGDADWRAEMMCDAVNRSDSVYPEFDPEDHVREFGIDFTENVDLSRESFRGWLGGIDFGFRAPTVLLHAWLDESRDVLHIVAELVVDVRTTDEIIRLAQSKPWPRPEWIGADPAGRQRSDQTGVSTIALWQRAGYVIRARPMRIEPGIAAIRARLRRADGSTGLLIHPRCRRLIEALTKYHYPPHRPEDSNPVKDGNDHAVDALRYLVVNLDRTDWGVKVVGY